jgi:tetratricopeptide (TPR) repeat protein
MRIKYLMGFSLVAALAVLASAAPLGAQVSQAERDRVLGEARDLVRTGNSDAAIRRVEALYKRAPLDGTIVQAYARLLTDAGDLDAAKAVLADYTADRRDDARAMSILASLYFQTGERKQGMETLEKIVARAPKELWPYQIGLDVLLDNNMGEAIVSHIERARKAIGDSTLFAVDAAKTYVEMKRFGPATHEYLRAGTAENMSAEIAADYIVAMARNDEARPQVIAALEKVRGLALFAQATALSLGEIYLMDDDCAHALTMLSQLVDMAPANADVLILFAQKASRAGCYGECAEAYDRALSHIDKEPKRAEYLLAKAGCEEKAGMLDRALSTFDTVAREYGAFKYGDEALMGRARILRDTGKIDEAIAEAERVTGSKYSEDALKAILFQGDCLVLLGRLDDAFKTYDRVSTDWVAQYAQEAFFNLGEISLYKGDFDDAQSYYNVTLRQYPDEPRANDAIARLLLVKSCGGEGIYRPQLATLSRAMLLKRQGRLAEAVGALKELDDLDAKDPLKAESLMLLAETYAEQGLFDDAITTYKLVGDSLQTPAAASALEAVGDIYLSLGRVDDAVTAYEDVILKFPANVSAGEARRKIDLATKEPDDET